MNSHIDVPMGPSGPSPESRIAGPAIALMITSGIGIALAVMGLLLNILGIGFGAAQGGDEGVGMMFEGGVGIGQSVIGGIAGVFIFIGALKMKSLQNYGLAMAATIIAMVPCVSPCCIITLPFGIWALVVLMNEDVKAAFDA